MILNYNKKNFCNYLLHNVNEVEIELSTPSIKIKANILLCSIKKKSSEFIDSNEKRSHSLWAMHIESQASFGTMLAENEKLLHILT